MAHRPSRNAPCPCESGQKYKRCCLALHEAAFQERRRVRAPVAPEDLLAASPYDEVDDLNDASNAVVELIGKGQLDEAERGAHELLRRYPDAVDGLEHLAYVYELRAERKKAAQTYRKAAAFSLIVDGLEGEIRSHFLAKVQELDPKR